MASVDYVLLTVEILALPSSWSSGSSDGLGVSVGTAAESWVGRGLTLVTGSDLPRHSDGRTCCLTRNIVKVSSVFDTTNCNVLL